jgi:hypothetical protein
MRHTGMDIRRVYARSGQYSSTPMADYLVVSMLMRGDQVQSPVHHTTATDQLSDKYDQQWFNQARSIRIIITAFRKTGKVRIGRDVVGR